MNKIQTKTQWVIRNRTDLTLRNEIFIFRYDNLRRQKPCFESSGDRRKDRRKVAGVENEETESETCYENSREELDEEHILMDLGD